MTVVIPHPQQTDKIWYVFYIMNSYMRTYGSLNTTTTINIPEDNLNLLALFFSVLSIQE